MSYANIIYLKTELNSEKILNQSILKLEKKLARSYKELYTKTN